ncbi:hypothetical protein RJ639_019566 [Escallonia herrerae]|uniref:Aminotransferase class I/classII large domain-containing protein n=1 Tax=Escallonia herrerae TaxID=1293975 RepID=A0AA88V8V5_9ASTE|nr:hypothetical protein RJ639_019566 [Escallonia herrerae]
MGSYGRLATRALDTDVPVMVKILELGQSAKDALPLGQCPMISDPYAHVEGSFSRVGFYLSRCILSHQSYPDMIQGAVYWKPPEEALEKVKQVAWEPSTSRYGTHEGLPELTEALVNKLCHENKLRNSGVMVTAGSNQGFLNLVLTLCDVADSVVLFAPYFFNAYMSFQMTGINNILVGPSNPTTLLPDADWLEEKLSESKPVPKLVSIVNPGNPSGICIPEPLLQVSLSLSHTHTHTHTETKTNISTFAHPHTPAHACVCHNSTSTCFTQRISDICRRAGSWLVVDNAYEYFVYDDFKHSCVEGNHVINLFSFSKAYGIMGWRVGYIAYSLEAEGLRTQLLKVQDNIAICAPMISQRVALGCLEAGHEWVKIQVKHLLRNKELLTKALSPLGEDAIKGCEGAIYLWAKLPDKYPNDFEVVCWFAQKHGVMLLPGSACGVPGCIRITYGMLRETECEVAAKRLRSGLEELIREGMVG